MRDETTRRFERLLTTGDQQKRDERRALIAMWIAFVAMFAAGFVTSYATR
jgi:hypothetical protein